MRIINLAPPLPRSLWLTKEEADKINAMPFKESEKFNGKTEAEIKLMLIEEEIDWLNEKKAALKEYIGQRI